MLSEFNKLQLAHSVRGALDFCTRAGIDTTQAGFTDPVGLVKGFLDAADNDPLAKADRELAANVQNIRDNITEAEQLVAGVLGMM